MENINHIIYGKNDIHKIVNISIKDKQIYTFFSNGTYIKEAYIPYVLSPRNENGCERLIGNQHFKFIKEYNNISYYENIKNRAYKLGLMVFQNEVEAHLIKTGKTYFKGLTPKDISYLSFDIETSGLDFDNPYCFLISCTFRKENNIIKRIFLESNYETQQDMIRDFCNYIFDINPDVICGHNIVMYDIPYLQKIMNKTGESLRMGRDGSEISFATKTKELRKDGSQSYTYTPILIFGREIVDTFFLSIKYDISRKYESYSLKNIIKQEGLEKENRTFVNAANIKNDWYDLDKRKLIIQYAEEDSDDALKLIDLMISPTFYANQMIPKTFQQMIESATGSQLNSMMVRCYLQNNYSIAKGDGKTEYEGAISIGIPGIYKNCIKVDVASLYPSIIVEYGIENKNKDPLGYFLKIVKYLRVERLKYKKMAKETGNRYYNDLQETMKIMINSLYGFLGAPHLNYNYPEGAAEITRKGREILCKAIKWATNNEIEFYQSNEEKINE